MNSEANATDLNVNNEPINGEESSSSILINNKSYEFNFSNLSLENVLNEIYKLEELCESTIDLANYINVNVTAIRKILKKFDKKFKLHEDPVALYYIKKNLTDKKSPLFHILQFKVKSN